MLPHVLPGVMQALSYLWQACRYLLLFSAPQQPCCSSQRGSQAPGCEENSRMPPTKWMCQQKTLQNPGVLQACRALSLGLAAATLKGFRGLSASELTSCA